MPDLRTQLSEAAQTGDTAALRRLLGDNPSLASMPDTEGWTPLHLAAYFGHREAAEYLLSLKADVRSPALNPMRNQPLHAAASGRHADIAALLLQAGAEVDALQAGDWTPLHAAAQNGDRVLVELLLAHGAAVNPRSVSGATPLSLAEENGHTEVVELLRKSSGE